MTNVQIEAGTLTANHEDRIVSGLLLPYGEVGNTNLGRFSVDPGVFTIPADVSVLTANDRHDREQPLARFMTAVETAAGIVASFSVGKNPEGDALLAEIADPSNPKARRHLSVEVTGVVLRSGKALAGKVFGAAFVPKGAFPSATLMAADVGDDPEAPAEDAPPAGDPQETTEEFTEKRTDENGVVTTWKTTRTTRIEGDKTTITEKTVIEEPTPEGDPVGNAAVPATLVASAPKTPATPEVQVELVGMNLATLYATLAQAARTKDATLFAAIQEEAEAASTLFAALADIKATGTGGITQTITVPQWLGELWSGRAPERRYIPLFEHGDLTGFTVSGFKWNVPPQVGTWAGNKTDVPSNAISFTGYTKDAVGLAGANDIDRRLRDFSVPEFWESYFRKMAESYAIKSDQGVLADVIAGATAVTAGVVPTGIDKGVVSIVDGALAVLDYGVPTFAIVAKDVWRGILLTPKDKILEYLNTAMGLEEGSLGGFKIIPARGTDVAAGKVVVGVKSAATVLELPGSPIRVEGLDMIKGGIDPGLFGYYTTIINEAKALAIVTPAA